MKMMHGWCSFAYPNLTLPELKQHPQTGGSSQSTKTSNLDEMELYPCVAWPNVRPKYSHSTWMAPKKEKLSIPIQLPLYVFFVVSIRTQFLGQEAEISVAQHFSDLG